MAPEPVPCEEGSGVLRLAVRKGKEEVKGDVAWAAICYLSCGLHCILFILVNFNQVLTRIANMQPVVFQVKITHSLF